MSTEIHIISGFLGAGKTTLIQKLLREAFNKDKVVIIENDFGEVSVDAALLKSGGIEVKEINSGCICCSLSGDFVKAIIEIIDKFQPDKIIIEPSGVAKLSYIIKACSDRQIIPIAQIKSKITVSDVKRCKMYLDNFGEFFEDQITNADIILLSRTDAFPEKATDARKLIESLNAHAVVLSKPWEQIKADEILFPQRSPIESTHICGCAHGCSCHHHDEHDACCHDHAAQDIFDTVTIHTDCKFTIEALKACINKLEHNLYGTVLRAKGIVRGANGHVNLQYIPGDVKITSCAAEGNTLCVIGRDLNRNELVGLFNEG